VDIHEIDLPRKSVTLCILKLFNIKDSHHATDRRLEQEKQHSVGEKS